MKRKTITGTELNCSVLSLGSLYFGSKIDEVDSFRLLDSYFDRGGNFIDTAHCYANWLPVESSISEKTIGKWMKQRRIRNQVVVATKGAHPKFESMDVSRVRPQEILQDLNESLRHLQVDTIDLYWLHRDDPTYPIEEILGLLNDQVKAGKIRYFGCSNWTTERIRQATQYAIDHGIQGFCGNQMMWSLAEVDRTKLEDHTLVTMDEDMKQFHEKTQMSAIPYSSQAQGMFTKWENKVYSLHDEKINSIYRSQENWERYERVHKVSEELSYSVTQVVLGYLLSQSFNTFPIIGCRSLEQLEESLKAVEVNLDNRQLSYLEKGVVSSI
ncbi:aldo/keto reductase [Neobacillus pocheonensis]|uniref:aldo/keto reductase n=1 Tax=Neobacillus pocheonensis TaxID=363869 RepID=UPI003D26B6AD